MRGISVRLAGLLLSIAALAGHAAPALASAVGAPQISAAGIDATDRFVVTWVLAPGTTFKSLEFSTVPIANPLLPSSFAGANLIDSTCAAPPKTCAAAPGLTVYRSTDRVARDRRYFVKVNAREHGHTRTSPVWVIDTSKPLLPGGGRPTVAATNAPVFGQPYIAPPPKAIPAPKMVLPAPPETIAGVLRYGVHARVLCKGEPCYALVSLELGHVPLVFSDTTVKPGGSETFALRPRPVRRARLARRKRAKLRIRAEVTQPGGKRTILVRTLTVRR
ncbi:MAG TPA: hypothetical protein VHZ31_03365 [Solirubrobacteraceae bacterium]|jgi:hypothetical protein|nr:hypothetical protein [Solirubrobacteraceae bacterium]